MSWLNQRAQQRAHEAQVRKASINMKRRMRLVADIRRNELSPNEVHRLDTLQNIRRITGEEARGHINAVKDRIGEEALASRVALSMYEGQIKDLLNTYGHGCRPSWVSEHLQELYSRVSLHQNILKELEDEKADN